MSLHAKPKRAIEVGSGFPSCVILDTAQLFLNRKVEFTSIEPYPDRLLSLLRPDDPSRVEILIERVQDVSVEMFTKLDMNDIIFIDSGHVAKTGSDVNYILDEVLPRLRPGLYVHVHDICYPFEYPEEWTRGKRSRNEAYALRTFPTFNETFEIMLFNAFLERFHREMFESDLPLCLRNKGGSIWLRRVR
jgi:hypothetical protein